MASRRGGIDVLLGTDHYHLMYPKQEVVGKPNQPYARLCPLGWTAIGRVSVNKHAIQGQTRFLHSFRSQQTMDAEVVDERSNNGNATLEQFSYLETMGIIPTSPYLRGPKCAVHRSLTESSTKCLCRGRKIALLCQTIDGWQNSTSSQPSRS